MRFVAIVKFVKCFVGGSARIQLDEKVVFQNKIGALRVFNYFKDLRNKHFVHHENSYTQSVPTATLNNGRKDFKIERIVAISAVGITLDQANYANLLLAATDSLDCPRQIRCSLHRSIDRVGKAAIRVLDGDARDIGQAAGYRGNDQRRG